MRYFMSAAAFAFFCTIAPASAQGGAPLQPGEILENGGGEQVKVLQCRAATYGQRECQTVSWQGGVAVSNPAWWNEQDLIKSDTRVREALGKPPRRGAGAAGAGAGAAGRPAASVPARGGVAARPAPAPRPATGGGRIPDGTYHCMTWLGSSYVTVGTLRSVNNSLDTRFLAKTGSTFTGATPNADGVTINYLTRTGYRDSMDCKRQ